MRSLLLLASLMVVGCGTTAPPARAPKAGPSPFQEQVVEGLGDPEVVVENQSDRPFTLVLSGAGAHTLTIPPHDKRTVKLAAGSYTFHASAPDVKPLDGQHTFELDRRYSWTFFVDEKDPDEGKGWVCFSIATTPFLGCERTADACKERRDGVAKDPAAPKLGLCEPLTTPWTFVQKDKKREWFGKDEANCNKARDTYQADEKLEPLALSACKPRP